MRLLPTEGVVCVCVCVCVCAPLFGGELDGLGWTLILGMIDPPFPVSQAVNIEYPLKSRARCATSA